jgi:hypothetical protein
MPLEVAQAAGRPSPTRRTGRRSGAHGGSDFDGTPDRGGGHCARQAKINIAIKTAASLRCVANDGNAPFSATPAARLSRSRGCRRGCAASDCRRATKSRFTTLVLLVESRESYLQIRVQSHDTRTLSTSSKCPLRVRRYSTPTVTTLRV